MIPEPWVFMILTLAAFRVWFLLARDTILEPLRDRLVRGKFAEFVGCPFCLGAWLALGWWAAWYWLSPHWTIVAAVPFALSAVVGVFGALVTEALDD